MKIKLISIVLALASFTAVAQTNIQTTFFQSVSSYFTSFDTNSTTFKTPVDIWTADNYRSGVNSSAELGASYDLWHPSTNTAIAPEFVFRNAGIAGTVVGEQGGVDFSIIHYDAKLSAYLDLGYSQFDSRGYIEVGIRAKKALSQNTYAGIGLGLQQLFGRSRAQGVNTTALLPTVSVFAGFTIPGF